MNMPTDEQLREREKELRRQVREPWLTFSEKHRAHLNTSELFFLREGYEAAWIQRDAEVQALRELLTQVTEELAEEVTGNYKARYGDPIHPAMEDRYARDMDTVYRARKLLAGGEEGEAE